MTDGFILKRHFEVTCICLLCGWPSRLERLQDWYYFIYYFEASGVTGSISGKTIVSMFISGKEYIASQHKYLTAPLLFWVRVILISLRHAIFQKKRYFVLGLLVYNRFNRYNRFNFNYLPSAYQIY